VVYFSRPMILVSGGFSGWWLRGRLEEFVSVEVVNAWERMRATIEKEMTEVRAAR